MSGLNVTTLPVLVLPLPVLVSVPSANSGGKTHLFTCAVLNA